MDPSQHHNALNRHDRLHWYEIESILGQGGFGITYLARDTNLDQKVAIKEYLPSEFSTRDQQNTVQPISENHTEIFDWGKQRFLDEARTLAQFRHPNVVRVSSFFENNNTGYMVMDYEEGTDLAALIKAGENFDEKRLLEVVLPVLDGLALVHEQGFIHRDIKPANIFIRTDGSPVLIDFGSARQAIGGQTKTLTSLVTPGFAPFEQYHDTDGKQGPWTDIYSLGATCYAMLTGKAPVDALKRGMARLEHSTDAYLQLVDLVGDRYSEHVLEAIDRALEFKETDRPQSVGEWQAMLRGEQAVPQAEIPTRLSDTGGPAQADGNTEIVTRPAAEVPTEAVATEPVTESVATTRPDTTPSAATGGAVKVRRVGLVGGILLLVVIAVAVGGYLARSPGEVDRPAGGESPAAANTFERTPTAVEASPATIPEAAPVAEQAQSDAEQQALRDEQARIAEQKARLAAEKVQLEAEQKRQQEIARQQAEEQRRQELAKQQAEARRQQQLAKQQAEQKRQQELARQQAEAKRQQELAKLQAEQQRQQQAAASGLFDDLTGTYRPDEGFEDLKLTQTGDKVKGIIGSQGSTLEGTRKGNRITFVFRYSPTGFNFKDGFGRFNISADGRRLTGTRSRGGFPGNSQWNLTRQTDN